MKALGPCMMYFHISHLSQINFYVERFHRQLHCYRRMQIWEEVFCMNMSRSSVTHGQTGFFVEYTSQCLII